MSPPHAHTACARAFTHLGALRVFGGWCPPPRGWFSGPSDATCTKESGDGLLAQCLQSYCRERARSARAGARGGRVVTLAWFPQSCRLVSVFAGSLSFSGVVVVVIRSNRSGSSSSSSSSSRSSSGYSSSNRVVVVLVLIRVLALGVVSPVSDSPMPPKRSKQGCVESEMFETCPTPRSLVLASPMPPKWSKQGCVESAAPEPHMGMVGMKP